MKGSITPLMIPTPWVYGIGFAFRDTQTKFPFVSEQLVDWGRPTFLVLSPFAISSSRVTATQCLLFLIPEVYPKTVVWKGGEPRGAGAMMEGTGGYKPENPQKKESRLENNKRRERFGFEMC